MSDPSPALLTDLSNAGVLRLTMNRAKRFNPLSEAMLEALDDAFTRASEDSSVRVIVLAAEGKAFCAGHDLKEMHANPQESYYRELFARCSKMMLGITRCPKPVIARVQGMATAAGCQLVATCDLAVADMEATFAVSGISNGLFCSTPSVALSRNVPRKQAFAMLMSGEFINADVAKERGLINQVATYGQLDNLVRGYVDTILAKSQVAVETGKRMFYEQISMDLPAAYDFAGEVMACNMMAHDAREGIGAFLEKRRPTWRHE